ncbi:hypothetical protein [Candidatus Ichthyocystis sparus]|uniref:hypothetical protein n=1 Tax=Candidatus Ichthyocystis sparus TaxID=1561004 RepID=UPI00159ED5F8|nr:hypothetical protein [Candidatus Ichthyocystis sparus]
MSPGDFADLVLNFLFAKRDHLIIRDGISALSMAMCKNRVSAIKSYAVLLDKVLSMLEGTISNYELAELIYKLISYYSPYYKESPLFTALSNGYSDCVVAFGLFVDKLLSMRNFVEDVPLMDMIFNLLMCKSDDIRNDPGLFTAMRGGHCVAIDSFRKLLEKVMVFESNIFSEYFNSMLLDTVISRGSGGVSGLYVALANNFPEVVLSYGSLLSLIPEDELVDVLVDSGSCSSVPAALFAGGEALDSYLKIISDLPARVVHNLYSRLNCIKNSVGYTSLSNADLDGRYEFLL